MKQGQFLHKLYLQNSCVIISLAESIPNMPLESMFETLLPTGIWIVINVGKDIRWDNSPSKLKTELCVAGVLTT